MPNRKVKKKTASDDVPSSQSEMIEYIPAKNLIKMISLNADENDGVHGGFANLLL